MNLPSLDESYSYVCKLHDDSSFVDNTRKIKICLLQLATHLNDNHER